MISGVWCGQMGVGGWFLMGLFWVTFVGLVLWALSRLFGPARSVGGLHEHSNEVDLQLAEVQIDPSDSRSQQEQPSSPRPH